MRDLEGKTVFVTGASRGLGRAIALAFGKLCAYVYVGFHTMEREAFVTLRDIESSGGEGSLLQMDVRDRSAVRRAVSQIASQRKGLDVLINNAGLVSDNLLPLMSPRQWDDVIHVNLTGVFNCCSAVASHMMSRRKGAIVNICSVASLHASPGQVNYAASKGGILALTKTLAAELSSYGIRVNAVVPGLLSTGMAARMDHRILEKKQESIPLKRLGTADEVADVVVFLASEKASYIVGQAIVVDGGMTL